MIRIELQFETGAEARQALTELLGGQLPVQMNWGNQIKGNSETAIKDEKITENFETPKMEVVKEEKAPVKSKRRTRAEIEADENMEKSLEEPIDNNVQTEEPAKDEPKASTITKEMLQAKAVELIRNGKKEQVTATIKSFDADSISQPDKKPVKVEDYAALMDAFNKI